MKLIKPYYEIVSPIDGEEILKQIELAARTCYKSEGKIEYKKIPIYQKEIIDQETVHWNQVDEKFEAISARVLIPKLIQRGHDAMLEFGGQITVKFICDRGVSHELVRHRLCSFAQESTRYCNYGNKEHIVFIIPCWLDNIPEGEYDWNDYTNGTYENLPIDRQDFTGASQWLVHMFMSEISYTNKINQINPFTGKKDGRFKQWVPQQARSVLPNSLKTEINASANIREWRHIFKQRTSAKAHPQMQELMRPLLKEFQSKIPILFDNITY